MRVVLLGLSITSSWGNGHATNYRALVKALERAGHDVLFLERDRPWYAENRDLPSPPYGRTELYGSLDDLRERFAGDVRDADLTLVGSYVPDGVAVGEWVTAQARGVTAFWDIDTPVTVAKLERGDFEYLTPELLTRYRLYLSFTGGPLLRRLERELGARRAVAFHCMVDPELYRPVDVERRLDLGYLGTYSEDRQPAVERLLLEPVRALPDARFAVAGPQYPPELEWPANVERTPHLAPSEHPAFYCAQRFTLNVTRRDMVAAGWSPSVRLFEAAACGVPVVSDEWAGLESFFVPGREIVVARAAGDVVRALREIGDEERAAIAERARRRVLTEHTAERRVSELEREVRRARERRLPTLQSSRGYDGDDPLEREVAGLGPWFHNLHLPDGRQTAPDHPLGDFPAFKWAQIAPHLPADLSGWRALDIGCNAGFYSFELARRGAQVVGVDLDERYLEQARWAAPLLGLEDAVEFRRMSVYDLGRSPERYDLVLFLGVLYHLRHPLLALDLVATKAERLLVLQTMTMPDREAIATPPDLSLDDRDRLLEPGWPRMAFIEHDLAGDPTNWWAPSEACLEAMVRSAGLQIASRPGHEILLCRPVGDGGARDEELAAVFAPEKLAPSGS